ncbi:MAG: hypothetical protein WDM78_20280 [Puia sp.]
MISFTIEGAHYALIVKMLMTGLESRPAAVVPAQVLMATCSFR